MISRSLLLPKNKSFFLFGPRMTGKSTLLKSELKTALRIDLLEEANYQRYLSNPSALADELTSFEKKKPQGWVIIDEIQRIPALLNEVHRTLESTKLKFALSGSSARKLKRGGANLLAGRAIELRLFSLSSIEIGNKFVLSDVIRWGSLPSIWLSEPEAKKQILKTYISMYLREEIQAEGMVRNLQSFSRFLQLVGESIARELNYSAISKETSVTSKTIREYFEILEDTLIGFMLLPWKKSIRKQLAGSPKFYLFDNGVTNALRENLSDLPTGEVWGALFEQWVIQEVRTTLSYRSFEGSIYYWKARGGNEVDLVIARGNKPILAVEIKSTQRPSDRHFSGLRSFAEEYPKIPLVLVTQQSRNSTHGKIEAMPALEFINDLWLGRWHSW